MIRHWIIAALMLGLAFGASSGVEAASSKCPDTGGTQYIVDTPADATDIAAGYNNPTCELIIKISVTPAITSVQFVAKKISVLGDGVTPLDIINSLTSGDILFDSILDIHVQNANIRAKDDLKLDCSGIAPLCKILVEDSSLIASNSLSPFINGNPALGFDPTGELRLVAKGNIDLERSNIYGGSGLHMTSTQGGITWFCPGGGAAGCKDPLGPPFVVDQLCPKSAQKPTGFPCTVTFNTPADLHAVCFPGTAGTICGGGATETRISAFLDVDISGSTIVFLDHVTITSVTGGLKAGEKGGAPSNLTGLDNITVSVKTTIDVTHAIWDFEGNIILETGSGCIAPATCIDAKFADFNAKNAMTFTANNKLGIIDLCAGRFVKQGGFPKMNGGLSPPYNNNVLDTALECAPLPAAKFN